MTPSSKANIYKFYIYTKFIYNFLKYVIQVVVAFVIRIVFVLRKKGYLGLFEVAHENNLNC